MRLSFSHLTEVELDTAVERLAAVVRGALVTLP
jgi:DNA-binding transcriptional MocR family regulator